MGLETEQWMRAQRQPPRSADEVVFAAWKNQVTQLRKQILDVSTASIAAASSASTASSSAASSSAASSSAAAPAGARSSQELRARRSRDSPEKRQAYRDLEIARMDFCESSEVEPFLVEFSHASAERQAAMRTTPLGQQILRLLDEFDELRALLDIHVCTSPAERVVMLVKMVILIAYVLASIIVFLPLLSLRLLHPTLRKLGLKNHFLPIDMIQKWFARGFLFLAGIQLQWEGLETVDYGTPTIAMFNHASNLDPFIVGAGPYAFKWLGKDSLFKIPFFGWVLSGWGHIPINRSNRTAALESLSIAVQTIRQFARSVAISAEGKRSSTGRLTDFKKGPFHTALQVGLPITPIVIYGAYELWPNSRISTLGGVVRIKILPRIAVSEKHDTHTSLMSRVRRAMLNDSTVPPSTQPYTRSYAIDALWFPASCLLVYGMYAAMRGLIVAVSSSSMMAAM